MAFGHPDGSVTLLDLSTGGKRTLSGQGSGSIEATRFSPDGLTLATAADNGTVGVWDVRTGVLRENLHRPIPQTCERRCSAPTVNSVHRRL